MSATTTAQGVFNIALGLMDEVGNDSDYSDRVLLILNSLGGELYPLSDTYSVAAAGTRPVFTTLTDLADTVTIDDTICRSVMPYGLAAHLLLNENPTMASFFQQRYEELKSKLATAPAEFSEVEDTYEGSEYINHSRW